MEILQFVKLGSRMWQNSVSFDNTVFNNSDSIIVKMHYWRSYRSTPLSVWRQRSSLIRVQIPNRQASTLKMQNGAPNRNHQRPDPKNTSLSRTEWSGERRMIVGGFGNTYVLLVQRKTWLKRENVIVSRLRICTLFPIGVWRISYLSIVKFKLIAVASIVPGR